MSHEGMFIKFYPLPFFRRAVKRNNTADIVLYGLALNSHHGTNLVTSVGRTVIEALVKITGKSKRAIERIRSQLVEDYVIEVKDDHTWQINIEFMNKSKNPKARAYPITYDDELIKKIERVEKQLKKAFVPVKATRSTSKEMDWIKELQGKNAKQELRIAILESQVRKLRGERTLRLLKKEE